MILLLLCFGFLFLDRIYTAITFLSLAVLLTVCAFILNSKWVIKFYIVYAVLLIPFLIVNGILTGTGLAEPVVWYNTSGIIGLRILTIPVEDVFYGMELILLNVLIYEKLKKVYQTKPMAKTPIHTDEY